VAGNAIADRQFRQVMGRFATGVTVVTTAGEGRVHGMTANAYMAVSLSPQLCLVSIAKTARMHEYLVQSQFFGVSFLSEEQQYLSQHFAGLKFLREEPTFRYFGRIPVLPDCVGVVAAGITRSTECGDHTLFVGEIENMEAGEGAPLLFYGGRYGALDQTHRMSVGQPHSFW